MQVYFLHSVLSLTNSTLTIDNSTLVLFESTLHLHHSLITLKNGAKIFFYHSNTTGDAFPAPGSPIKGTNLGSSVTALLDQTFTTSLLPSH